MAGTWVRGLGGQAWEGPVQPCPLPSRRLSRRLVWSGAVALVSQTQCGRGHHGAEPGGAGGVALLPAPSSHSVCPLSLVLMTEIKLQPLAVSAAQWPAGAFI